MAKQQRYSKPGNPQNKTGGNKGQFKKGFDERRHLEGAPPKPTRLQLLETAFGGTMEPEFEKQTTTKALRYLIEMTPDELRVLVKRKDLAAFVIGYAKDILKSINDKDTKAMETIMNRAYGKPTSRLTFTDSQGNDNEGPGIVIFLPDNGRQNMPPAKEDSAQPPMDKPEPK